jgi:hypothetical protein
MYICQLFNVDANAQDLIFVAKVPFSSPSNLNWGKATIIRGNNSTLDTFKELVDSPNKRRKRLEVQEWEKSFLLLLEFKKTNKEEILFNSFTRVHVDGRKISIDLWDEKITFPNLDKLLEIYPELDKKRINR